MVKSRALEVYSSLVYLSLQVHAYLKEAKEPITSCQAIQVVAVNLRAYNILRWRYKIMTGLFALSMLGHLFQAFAPPTIIKDGYGVTTRYEERLSDALATLELKSLIATTQQTQAREYRQATEVLHVKLKRRERQVKQLRLAAIEDKITGSNTSVDARELAREFLRVSETHGVPVEIILRMAKVESNFEASAVSPVGAKGIMQVMPFWKDKCWAWDGEGNIDCGVRILKYECARATSMFECLGKYNGASTDEKKEKYFAAVMRSEY